MPWKLLIKLSRIIRYDNEVEVNKMEDAKSVELMQKNASRIQREQKERKKNRGIVLSYFKRIIKYISLGNLSYAIYALKRACKVAITKVDDNNDKVAKSTKVIDEDEKIVIYSVLFGNYDELKEPLYITPNCDYYVLTNQEVPKKSVWKKYSIEDFEDRVKGFSNLEKARFFKTHPQILFPEYKYSMFIDANIQMVTDMRPVFAQLEENFIAIHNQTGRDCVYQEATEIIVIGKANKKEVKHQMNVYKKEGFPEHYGLFRTCVVVREHNDSNCVKLMELWWDEIQKYTKRDQLSFTYALWKMGLDKKAVSNLGYDPRTNPRFIEGTHI